MSVQSLNSPPIWLDQSPVDTAELEALIRRTTPPSSVPLAADIVHQIPVYEGEMVAQAAAGMLSAPQRARALQQEWAMVLQSGAGVVVIRQAIRDNAMLDQVSECLLKIMDSEARAGGGADHFAAAGSNTRIWNAHEKLCMAAPELFARYNANDTLSLMCRAWLGPGYQITAQANIVHPGGRAQVCHRDYHMGFQQSDLLIEYPAHVHAMSPMLTLQGAIAHSDMPVDSGPTQLLPFSQSLLAGYITAAQDDCRQFFEANHVQLALEKGDMLFFNPALLHAAGDNNTDKVDRFANLLQVGSAYGRTLELLDRTRMSIALYPALQRLRASGELTAAAIKQVVEACAEGYAFPANMDLQPPVGGLAPQSQQCIMLDALGEEASVEEFAQRICHLESLKRSH